MKRILFLLFISCFAFGAESPVFVGQTKLFSFEHSAGGISPASRAQSAKAAIERVMEDPAAQTDSIYLRSVNGSLTVNFERNKLFTIYPVDTSGTGLTLPELGERWRRIVIDGIEAERKRSISAGNLAKLALGVLFPFLVIVAYYLISKLYSGLCKNAIRQEGRLFKGISLKGNEIMPSKLQLAIALKTLLFLKWAFLVLIYYTMILIFFNLFPATKGYTEAILEASTNWLRGVGGVLINVIKFAVFGIVFYAVARILWSISDILFRHYKTSSGTTRIPLEAIEPLRKITKLTIAFLYGLLLVAAIPGAGEYYALAMLTAVFVVIAVAGLPFIRSGIAGLSILALNRLKIGDVVSFRGNSATIASVGIVWTTLLFGESHEMTVLNSELLTGGLARKVADE